MQIEYTHDSLQTSMTICFNGRSLTIDHLVVDTGAVHSLLYSDISSEQGIKLKRVITLFETLGSVETNILFKNVLNRFK